MKPINVLTSDGAICDLQVLDVQDIPAGDFEPGYVFVVKNNTEETISVTGKTGAGNDVITNLYPGWNVEMFTSLTGVVEKTLQYNKRGE